MSPRRLLVLMCCCILCLGASSVFSQANTSGHLDGSFSSEWEATAFNNGRRVVRDSNGYMHAFWHSQPNPLAQPSALGCDLYYAWTTTTLNQDPAGSMAMNDNWSTPVNLTQSLGNLDNRYPSVAIEYDIYDGAWRQANRIHVVWQALAETTTTLGRYEVMYASIPITAPPAPPAPFAGQTNLSQTPTDSLVPAIAINQHNPDVAHQHLHVVWQEEDTITAGGQPGATEDLDFSDIAYIRSTDSGATWLGPGVHWGTYLWDNLTMSPANSQCPSISCILDQWTGNLPLQTGMNELGYNSDDVHVTWNEDVANGIHVFYLRSPNDGVSWILPRVDVSAKTGATGDWYYDYYSNVAVDMCDVAHVTFMRAHFSNEPSVTIPREPLRNAPVPLQYSPGINPGLWNSFPGPDPGMYAYIANSVVYAWVNGAPSFPMEVWAGVDLEFPTVALNRWQHLNVNWQQYFPANLDYEIFRNFNLNLTAPSLILPIPVQTYGGWNGTTKNDSNDNTRDDYFPNLAHKKTAMYRNVAEPGTAGYDEVWAKLGGHGEESAVSQPKEIWQDGNMNFDSSVPVRISAFSIE